MLPVRFHRVLKSRWSVNSLFNRTQAMKKMMTAPALMVLAGLWTGLFVSAVHAGDNADIQKLEKDMLDGFRHCVFTVNAYTQIESGQTESDKPKWNRNVGTALPIDSKGHLLTIHCVVKDAEKITVITHTGETVMAEVVGSDSSDRISVLRIDPSHIKEVPAGGDLDSILKGNYAFFLGVVPDMEIAVSRGLISSVRTQDGIFELLGPETAGTSGTPILDSDLNVLGILAFNVDTNEVEPGLAKYGVIPYEYAYILARYIINTDLLNIGWLGVSIDLASSGKGIVIDQVIDSSPADKAGIIAGDRILLFRDTTISSPSQFIDLLSGTVPADTVTVTILRGGESRAVMVTMGENPVKNQR